MKRRILSVVLALTMLLSLVPTAVFAVEGTEPAKKYVSLGDSMTNGYGLDGYEFEYYYDTATNSWKECTDRNCTATSRVSGHEYHAADPWGDANGFRQVAWDAYPNLMAEKYGWDHEQLAMAGMTTDMMRWIREFPIDPEDPNHDLAMEIITMEEWTQADCRSSVCDGCSDCIMSNGKNVQENWYSIWNYGDFHTFDQGPDSARMEKSFPDWMAPGWGLGDTGDAVADYIKVYQDAVKEADVISLCIGNGDFGNHMLNRIMWLLVGATDHDMKYNMNFAIGSLTEEQQAAILELEKKIQDKVALPDVPKEYSDRVVECVLYTTIAYPHNNGDSQRLHVAVCQQT